MKRSCTCSKTFKKRTNIRIFFKCACWVQLTRCRKRHHSCPRCTWWYHNRHNRKVWGNFLLKWILQLALCLPSPHPGGLRALVAAGPSVCSAALPEGSSPPWGPESHQGGSPPGPPGFEWADEPGNMFKMPYSLRYVVNVFDGCVCLKVPAGSNWGHLTPD